MGFTPSPNITSGPTIASGSLHQVTGTLATLGAISSSSGISPLGTGANSVQIGDGAIVASGAGSIAVGKAANAVGAGAVAIGDSAKADHVTGYGVALGFGADAGGVSSIAIGSSADASAAEAIAIGPETTTATDAASIALGAYADATGEEAIAIGKTTQATANDAIAIGEDAAGSQTDTVAIGRATVASQPNAIAIGVAAKGQHQDTISMGHGANATVANAIAFGSGTLNQTTNTMTIGSSHQSMDLNVTGNVTLSGTLVGFGSETIGGTDAGIAISVNTLITFIDDGASGGGQTTFSIASGSTGQIKIITMTVPKGGGTNPALAGGPGSGLAANVPTGVTFTNPGDSITMVFNGTMWAVAGSYGATVG